MWFNSFVNAICDGNEVYDELYSSTAVYRDVEDVNAVGDLFSVESADQIIAFTNANEFQDLVDHINAVIQVSHTDNYGDDFTKYDCGGFCQEQWPSCHY